MFIFPNLFDAMFSLIFLLVIGIFIFTAVKGINQWHKNNNAPRLTVPATVISKRINITHHTQENAGDITGMHGYHTTSSTNYYVTFQLENSSRLEFHLSKNEYNILTEGTTGNLSFQGTRYLSFTKY